MSKCRECGLEIFENTEAFLLNRVQWGGEEKFCHCNKLKDKPEVELISAVKWTKDLSSDSPLLGAFLASAPREVTRQIKNAFTKCQENQRWVDAGILRETYNKFYAAGGASMALEHAAKAIKDNKPKGEE